MAIGNCACTLLHCSATLRSTTHTCSRSISITHFLPSFPSILIPGCAHCRSPTISGNTVKPSSKFFAENGRIFVYTKLHFSVHITPECLLHTVIPLYFLKPCSCYKTRLESAAIASRTSRGLSRKRFTETHENIRCRSKIFTMLIIVNCATF